MTPERLPLLAYRPVFLVAVRWLAAVRRTRGISFISMISVMGLMLGVAALVTVLSVMNGFDRELRSRILGIVPHVLVSPAAGADVDTMLARLRQRPEVRGAARFAEVRGMITTGQRVLPVALIGIDPAREPALSPLDEAMVRGRLAELDAEGGVLLGAPLASRLGLLPGDRVTFLLPRARGDSVQPELMSAQIHGLFRLGAEPDYAVAFMHVDALTGRGGIAELQLRLALDDLFRAPLLRRTLATELAGSAGVSDWTDRYGELFEAVGMEKSMMAVLLGLIVAIAVFNIIASLAMGVDEKRGAIAILRTLGASRGEIVRIFVLQGALVGIAGVGIGLGLGALLALNIGDLMQALERTLDFRLLAGTYFDRLPSELLIGDLIGIGGAALVLSLAGALYPALRAGRVDPAPALHGA